jgi:hypothetical protein
VGVGIEPDQFVFGALAMLRARLGVSGAARSEPRHRRTATT